MKLLALLAIPAVASAASLLAAEILYWPFSSPQPSPLALINYDPSTLQSTLVSYTPPTQNPDEPLLSIGLYTPASVEKQWTGILTSVTQLAAPNASFTLYLARDNLPYHVSISPSLISSSTTGDSPQVEIIRDADAAPPKPHLNKPVVLSPDGKHPGEVEEKTLFQRYWWLLPILMFLLLSGGGGEGR